MFTKVFVLLAVAAQALAGIHITAPIASTTFSGGKQATVTWIDNGQAPPLKDFGPAIISIYAGNALQQTSLQVIAPSVDVSTQGSVTFNVDATIGPNSNEYFIRIESLSLKDSAQPQYPALAFSAKFTLNEMTGTFSPAILSQIAGQSTAPLQSQTSAAPRTTGTAAATTTGTTGAAARTTSAAPTGTNAASQNSGAISSRTGWAGIVIGAIAGAALF
ncbi:hypothetical protein EST38_g2640 [Candolleomyces aberdarensis]|uniref:Yeast cell wall synthesis Kre9/Knh1-like N-terminal domain-containing protein n=1 Tax=Candolleomyces aberdarensis TaxID=2316362 RepID=A0A4Q2DW82_9AGAR|nr:hypothetical protein EST38_g2640 [Candolleomyces aberdarensis]